MVGLAIFRKWLVVSPTKKMLLSLWPCWSRHSRPDAFEWLTWLLPSQLACYCIVSPWFGTRWLVHPASSPSIGQCFCHWTFGFLSRTGCRSHVLLQVRFFWPSPFLQLVLLFSCLCCCSRWIATRSDTKCRMWLVRKRDWGPVSEPSKQCY